MLPQCHILNGDALKYQFPKALKGKLIIARECFIEGTTKGDDFDSFFTNRANFICKNYDETEENYFKKFWILTKTARSIFGLNMTFSARLIYGLLLL